MQVQGVSCEQVIQLFNRYKDTKIGQVLNVCGHCSAREQIVSPVLPFGGSADAYIPQPVKVKVGEAIVCICNRTIPPFLVMWRRIYENK